MIFVDDDSIYSIVIPGDRVVCYWWWWWYSDSIPDHWYYSVVIMERNDDDALTERPVLLIFIVMCYYYFRYWLLLMINAIFNDDWGEAVNIIPSMMYYHCLVTLLMTFDKCVVLLKPVVRGQSNPSHTIMEMMPGSWWQRSEQVFPIRHW